jgi:tungstate transport system substrate-binding protein
MTALKIGVLLGATSLVAIACATSAPSARPRVVMMASTIGPIDAGIVAALEDAFRQRTGIDVRHAGAGTGAALDMAKTGSFDLVLVHARRLEDEFVAAGFGVDRRDVMYNDFVILGPASDPARIRGERSAATALAKIASARALFVTRGDQSGTHVKELEIWQKAGIKPSGSWYATFERGAAGNVPTTRYANERQAYVLMDRATVLTLKRDLRLHVLVEKDEEPGAISTRQRCGRPALRGLARLRRRAAADPGVRCGPLRRAAVLPELRRMAQQAAAQLGSREAWRQRLYAP